MLRNISRWQTPASFWLTLILLASSAWLLGKMVWMLQSDSSTLSTWSPAQTSGSINGNQRLDLSSLQNGALFGTYSESKPAPVIQKVVDAPKTKLNLVLVGAVASDEATKNLAVIANRGSQSTYGLNEVIEGTRAKLKAVLPDRVIIENEGRDETLMLEGLDYSQRAPIAQKSEDTQLLGEEDKLDAIRESILKNPQEIFQYVRLSQVKEGDAILGYRVSPGKDAALFNSVGLQTGDIATEFNGLDLREPDVMNKLASSVSEMTEINLTVLRDGQPYDIYIQF